MDQNSMNITNMTSVTTMDHGDGMGGCKISMLWNWYTLDACFISTNWKITSAGMFAGSCIAVMVLVMMLEMLRRGTKEYDRYLARQHKCRLEQAVTVAETVTTEVMAMPYPTINIIPADIGIATTNTNETRASVVSSKEVGANDRPCSTHSNECWVKPSFLQQALRALLHTLQFALAYFLMLLAMYYNGFIIASIFVGSYLGYFFFGWEALVVTVNCGRTSAANEPTVCCG